ncbi:DUF4148 domain-containing protein [Burkholderia pseudomultivorans]|uniref:DUF4148 domain-containing protein n=2 Tax=Burkholderia cepacia complex TaxID=87882 RepID=A0A132EQM0_9BURK|nr:DUF4148 domain-containing protein [Burkholderia pseudomultivorans]AIO36411.1 hypothetical protein DM39_5282 [Burkholderia cenocepacia]EGD00550.1 hypothetical protein B1M_31000 [Burkholderia sp. TJI49]AOI87540.1 hypothetical protein WS57_01345 [Burkholderia pseudomultivorans]KVC18436.1 hypothetical protein WS55_24200 [Burkholderia pseudomultivorans]KVC28920.1 hypothetical protein WS56_21190 [Burkholderia pseudomultivorans]
MNRRNLLSAVALALAVSAPAFADTSAPHAGDYGNTSWYSQHNGPRTRAEVNAEVEQARRDGTLAYLRKATSYPQGLELAQGPYRPTPEGNQLAGAGR